MKKTAVLDICLCAVSIALHIVLELFCTIRIGNDLKITLCALPFIIIALLCGPLEGFISGCIGTFLSQLLTFGITVTTPLWVIPYAVQGLLTAILYRLLRKKTRYALSVSISVFAAGLISVILMWIASYVDGVVVFKYMTKEVMLGLIPVRLLVWVIVSVIYSAISIPLIAALKRTSPELIRTKNN